MQSFLYGKGNENDNLQTLKQDLRKNTHTIANLQKSKHEQVNLPKAALAKQQEQLDDDDPFCNNPPIMEFTNE